MAIAINATTPSLRRWDFARLVGSRSPLGLPLPPSLPPVFPVYLLSSSLPYFRFLSLLQTPSRPVFTALVNICEDICQDIPATGFALLYVTCTGYDGYS